MINQLATVRLGAGCSLSFKIFPPGPDAVPFAMWRPAIVTGPGLERLMWMTRFLELWATVS